MRGLAGLLAVGLIFAIATTTWQTGREELDSRQPPKVLPIDGDYPGGTTGVPVDGYWPLDTAHGATPYFGEPSVVYNSNVIDFPYGAEARRQHFTRRQQALAATFPPRQSSSLRVVGGRDQQLASDVLPSDWAMPVENGYFGEPGVLYPYMANNDAADVLETENDPISKQARYPYVNYHGQATSYDHGSGIAPDFYNYDDGYEAAAYDNSAEEYQDFLKSE